MIVVIALTQLIRGHFALPTLKIDLSTRVLDDQTKVNLIHPGARYSLYDHVDKDLILPVDIPFLDIPHGQRVPDASAIAPMLERARMMRKWAKRPRSEERTPRPAVKLDFYRTGLNLDAGAQGARTRLRNAAQEILWDLPEKSLAVIPHKSISGKAILAELGPRDADRTVVDGHGHYTSFKFLGRPISIVNKVPMLALPADVLGAARSTSAVQSVKGHSEDQILRLAYGDYQRDKDFVAGVLAGNDDFDALVLGQMIDLHVAIEHFLVTNETLEPGRTTWSSVIQQAPYLHAAINSPNGRASLQSKGSATFAVKLLTIVAASGIALTTAGDLIAQGNVLVSNSKEPGGDMTMIKASANALTDFFATSGFLHYNEYLEGLQNGLERNAAKPKGTAVIQP